MRRILVADTSSVVQSIEKHIISSSNLLQVAGVASNLSELEKLINNNIDGIVVDYEVISGKKILASIKGVFEKCQSYKIPVVLFIPPEFSRDKAPDGIATLVKPTFTSLNEKNLKEYTVIIEKLLTSSKHDILFKSSMKEKLISNIVPEKPLGKIEAVLIGVSTGGPIALQKLFKDIGPKFSVPIIVTQHVDSLFDKKLIEWLNSYGGLTVKMAEEFEVPRANHVYFAPADKHLVFAKNANNENMFILNDDPPVNFLKPAIDKMLESASEKYGNKCVAVIMTGMGNDGTEGCRRIVKKGGYTITEAERTCAVYGMPKAAVDAGVSKEELPLNEIGSRLKQLVGMTI